MKGSDIISYKKRIPPIKLELTIDMFNNVLSILDNSNNVGENLKEKILKYSIPNVEGSKTSVVIRLFLSEASQLMFLLINNLKSEGKNFYDYYDLLTKNRQIKEEL